MNITAVRKREPQTTVEELMDQVEFWARRLGRMFRLSESDRDDVRQELFMTVMRAMRRHDRSRACEATFITRVLDRHTRHIARRISTARARTGLSSQTLSQTSTPEPVGNDPGKGEYSQQDTVSLQMDVISVLNQMPTGLRQISEALMMEDASDVAERLGLHRSTVYRRIRQIRLHFMGAGIDGIG